MFNRYIAHKFPIRQIVKRLIKLFCTSSFSVEFNYWSDKVTVNRPNRFFPAKVKNNIKDKMEGKRARKPNFSVAECEFILQLDEENIAVIRENVNTFDVIYKQEIRIYERK